MDKLFWRFSLESIKDHPLLPRDLQCWSSIHCHHFWSRPTSWFPNVSISIGQQYFILCGFVGLSIHSSSMMEKVKSHPLHFSPVLLRPRTFSFQEGGNPRAGKSTFLSPLTSSAWSGWILNGRIWVLTHTASFCSEAVSEWNYSYEPTFHGWK